MGFDGGSISLVPGAGTAPANGGNVVLQNSAGQDFITLAPSTLTISAASAALSMSATNDVLLSSTSGALSLMSDTDAVTLQGSSGVSIVSENKLNSGSITIAPGTGTGTGSGTGGSVSIIAGGTALIGGNVVISEGTGSGTDGYVSIGSAGSQSRGFVVGQFTAELSATDSVTLSTLSSSMSWAASTSDVVFISPLGTTSDSRQFTLRAKVKTPATSELEIVACNHHPTTDLAFSTSDVYSLFVILTPKTPS